MVLFLQVPISLRPAYLNNTQHCGCETQSPHDVRVRTSRLQRRDSVTSESVNRLDDVVVVGIRGAGSGRGTFTCHRIASHSRASDGSIDPVGGWVLVWWGGGACARVRARAVPAAGPCLDTRRTTPLTTARVPLPRPSARSQSGYRRARTTPPRSQSHRWVLTSRTITHKFTPRHPLPLPERGHSNIGTSTTNSKHASCGL